MNFLREHPYLTGGFIIAIVVLFVVLKNRGSGSQVISSGPSEALQAAGLQAYVAQNQAQTAASLHLSDLNAAVAAHEQDAQLQLQIAGIQKDVALSSILTGGQVDLAKTDAATRIAQTQSKAQTDQTQAVVNGNVSVAGIQAGIQQHQFDVALAAQKDIDATTLQTTSLVNQGETDRARISADASNTIASTQAGRDISLATIGANTSTTLATTEAQRQTALAQITAPVLVHGMDTQAAIYNNLISTQGSITNNEVNTQDSIDQQVLSLIRSGQINKGGEGGQNQVATIDTLLGNYQGSATASQGAAIQGTAGAGLISGVIGNIVKGFASIFA